jgi:hypothetical protein
MRTSSFFIVAIACLGPLGSYMASTACADTIYESATPGNIGHDASVGYEGGPYYDSIGVRFDLTSPTIVTDIGGYFAANLSWPGQIFGAIIQLSGPNDFPDSTYSLNTSDVLAHTLITAGNSASDVSGTVGPLLLNPGYYAIVFGAGQFGAGTYASDFLGGASNIGSPSYIAFGGGNGWSNQGDTYPYRLFVDGTVASAPLPSTAFMGVGLLSGLGVFGLRRHRLRYSAGKLR